MDLEVRTSGRAAKPVEANFVRELEDSDLPLLQIEKGVAAPALKALRDRHHALARVLATGASPAEASIVTGYSLSRISILQADPAFRELLEYYRNAENIATAQLHDRLATLSLVATDILAERLEETPDEISNGTLLETIKISADRTGHGPQSRNVNVNVNVDLASRLAAARERAGLIEALPRGSGPVVDAEFEELPEAAE